MTNKNDTQQNSFISHLVELRSRLIKSFVFFLISFVICYFFSEEIYKFLVKPYSDAVLENNLDRRLNIYCVARSIFNLPESSIFLAHYL